MNQTWFRCRIGFDYPSKKMGFQVLFSPFDKFFSSSWKQHASESQRQRALHRRSWPADTHFKPSEETIKLLMKRDGATKWFHVRDLAPAVAKQELAAWRENNLGWEFMLENKIARPAPKRPVWHT